MQHLLRLTKSCFVEKRKQRDMIKSVAGDMIAIQSYWFISRVQIINIYHEIGKFYIRHLPSLQSRNSLCSRALYNFLDFMVFENLNFRAKTGIYFQYSKYPINSKISPIRLVSAINRSRGLFSNQLGTYCLKIKCRIYQFWRENSNEI